MTPVRPRLFLLALCAASFAVPGPSRRAAAAAPVAPVPAALCRGGVPSSSDMIVFYGTVYRGGGSVLDVEPSRRHPGFWEFEFNPPAPRGHAGDAYYGYAHATTRGGVTSLCLAGRAGYTPADIYHSHTPPTVPFRLEGIVDATTRTAHVTIAAGGRAWTIDERDSGVLAAARRAAPAATAHLLALFNRHDWPGVYRMCAPTIRRQLPERAFVGGMARQLIDVVPDGPPRLLSAHADPTALTAALDATAEEVLRVRVRGRTPRGSVYVHRGVLQLVWIGGAWYLGASDDWSHA